LGGSTAHRRIAALAGACALVVAGCGGSNEKQDVKEPTGNFPVKVVSASFPSDQKLAKDSTMEIVVQNAGQKTIPSISVTVKCGPGLGGSFQTAIPENTGENNADRERPQFVVNKIPTATERVNPPLRSSARTPSSTRSRSARSPPAAAQPSAGTCPRSRPGRTSCAGA
jgi:hypothetical protein